MRVFRSLMLLVVPLTALIAINALGSPKEAFFQTSALTIHGVKQSHHFTVEVALTPEQQSRGLMFRKTLGSDYGMLFPLKTPRELPMWMKNTVIPLDMLFIGPDWKISYIHADAVPQSETVIDSGGVVSAVLEIPGGGAAAKNIHVGDKVEYAGPRP